MLPAPAVVRADCRAVPVKRTLGQFGEAWAKGLLTRQGYRLVESNVRFRRGEIDLVAYDGETLVFVEVKCRRSTAYGSPESSITARRFAHLEAAIEAYLMSRDLSPGAYRVDVVAIEIDYGGRVIRGEILRNVEAPRS
jgi:putative endonuclease